MKLVLLPAFRPTLNICPHPNFFIGIIKNSLNLPFLNYLYKLSKVEVRKEVIFTPKVPNSLSFNELNRQKQANIV